MVAPALAPVIGGILTQFLGWKWVFWFLTILAGTYLIPLLANFPETGRNVVGNGSIPPQGWNMSLLNYIRTRKLDHNGALNRTVSREEVRKAQAELAGKRKLRWPNPLKAVHIILEKDVGLLLLYNALVYTAFYDVTASIPSQFAEIYRFNELQIGFVPLLSRLTIYSLTQLKAELYSFWNWRFYRVYSVRQTNGYELQAGG